MPGLAVNQHDRVRNEKRNLVGNRVRGPGVRFSGFHHVNEYLDRRVVGKVRTTSHQSTNPRMPDAGPAQDAQDVIPVQIEQIKRGEVGGHNTMMLVPPRVPGAEVPNSGETDASPCKTRDGGDLRIGKPDAAEGIDVAVLNC